MSDRMGNDMKFGFGQSSGLSSFFCHYAVHYADSCHQVLSVTEGYRLALIYNILWPIERDKCISKVRPIDEKLAVPIAKALSNWENKPLKPLFFPMEHSYTEKSLQFIGDNFLKGSDRDRFALLKKANELLAPEKQFSLALALVEFRMHFHDFDIDETSSGEASYQPQWPFYEETTNEEDEEEEDEEKREEHWYRKPDQSPEKWLSILALHDVQTGETHTFLDHIFYIEDVSKSQTINSYNWNLSESWGYPRPVAIWGTKVAVHMKRTIAVCSLLGQSPWIITCCFTWETSRGLLIGLNDSLPKKSRIFWLRRALQAGRIF